MLSFFAGSCLNYRQGFGELDSVGIILFVVFDGVRCDLAAPSGGQRIVDNGILGCVVAISATAAAIFSFPHTCCTWCGWNAEDTSQ